MTPLPSFQNVLTDLPDSIIQRQRDCIHSLNAVKEAVARDGDTPLTRAMGDAALSEAERVNSIVAEWTP